MNKRELVNHLVRGLDPRAEYERCIYSIFRQIDVDLGKFAQMMQNPNQFHELTTTEKHEVVINKTEIGINIRDEPGTCRRGQVLVTTAFAFNGCLTIDVEPVGQLAKPRSGLRFDIASTHNNAQEPIKTSTQEPMFTPADDAPQFSLVRPLANGGTENVVMSLFRDITHHRELFETSDFRPSIGFTDNGFYIVLS